MATYKLFCSTPMRGKEFEDVEKAFLEATTFAREKFPDDQIIPINTFLPPDVNNKNVKDSGLHCLGRSIQFLATADMVYFCEGWKEARGCVIEHDCAEKYGVKIIHD